MQTLWLHTLKPLLVDLALPPSPFLIALAAIWPLHVRRPCAGPAIAGVVGQAEAVAAQDVATNEFKSPLRWAEGRS